MTDPIYFVEQDFGKIGTEFVGRTEDALATVIDDILTGQHPNVVRVLEVREDDHSCQNITEDVARAVRDKIVNEQYELTYEMANWLHEQLGVGSIAWPRAAE